MNAATAILFLFAEEAGTGLIVFHRAPVDRVFVDVDTGRVFEERAAARTFVEEAVDRLFVVSGVTMSLSPSSKTKDPADVLDYSFDFTKQLAKDGGDTIASVTATAANGLDIDGNITHSDTVVTVWLAGGSAGRDYVVTVHVVTAAGREYERSATIKVREK